MLALCLWLATPLSHAQEQRFYNIPAGSLAGALNQFALEAGVSVLFDPAITQQYASPGLQGSYTLNEGFGRLLANTGLTFEINTQARQVTVSQPPLTKDSIQNLSPILVSSEFDGDQRVYEQADARAIVSREDMDRTASRHASEILQSTAGVYTTTNEQNPSVSVNVRGLKDFGRVNMNIDGMRQNFQRTGHGQRNGEMFFDTEFLSEVEIQKGAQAGAGGAGASGGIATFRTIETDNILSPGERAGGRLRLRQGVPDWDNGQELSGSLALAARPTSATDVLLAYSQQNSDVYEPGSRGKAIYWGQVDNQEHGYSASPRFINGTGQDMESWLAKGRWRATEALEFKLTALSTRATYGESQSINMEQLWRKHTKDRLCNPPVQRLLDDPDDPDWETYCNWEYDPENVYPISNTNKTSSQSYALDMHYAPGNNWLNANAKVYTVSTDNTSTTSANAYSPYTMKTRTDTLGALLDNTSHLYAGNHAFAFNYGVEWYRDENKPDANSQTLSGEEIRLLSGATPHGERSILGTWLRADWHYGSLTVSPALRWERYTLQGRTGFHDTYQGNILWQFANVEVDRGDSKLLPSLGLAFDAIDTSGHHLQLFASAGLGWRPPAITETFTASAIPGHIVPVTTYPNWTLEPEETQNAEVGINWRLGNHDRQLNIKLAQFYNRTENYILYGAGTNKPGRESGSVSQTAFYVNALNDLIFQGQELQLDAVWGSLYASLNVTHTERRTDDTYYYEGEGTPYLNYHPWVLGGPNGESPADYCPDAYYLQGDNCYTASTLYDPTVPEWTGKLTLGKHWLQGRLDTGATLTYASQTGDSYFTEGVDHTGAKQGLRDYLVADLYTSYKVLDNLRLGLNLKNLTDRAYIQAMGDDMVKSYAPGRTLTAHMQWNF